MERMKNEDFDCFLLRMEREFNGTGKQGEKNGGEREFACGFGFRIRIPPDFREGGKEEAEGIFWSQDRPPVLFLTPDRRAGITFRQMETEDAADACMGRIRRAVWQRSGRRCSGQTGGPCFTAAALRERTGISPGWNIKVLLRMKGCITLPSCLRQEGDASWGHFTVHWRIMTNGSLWFSVCWIP